MFSKTQLILLAGALLLTPLAASLAQQNNPTGNLGSNRSSTASPGTADSKAASGLNTGDVRGSGKSSNDSDGSTMNNTTPGATGQTFVPGTNSSQARASSGTAEQKSGAASGAGGGAGGK